MAVVKLTKIVENDFNIYSKLKAYGNLKQNMDAFLTSQLKTEKKIVIPEKWHFLPQKKIDVGIS